MSENVLDKMEELTVGLDGREIEAVLGKAFFESARHRLHLLGKWKPLIQASGTKEDLLDLQGDFIALREELGAVEEWERQVFASLDLNKGPALLAAFYAEECCIQQEHHLVSNPCLVGPRSVSLKALYDKWPKAFLKPPLSSIVLDVAWLVQLLACIASGELWDSSRSFVLVHTCHNSSIPGTQKPVGCCAAYHIVRETAAESKLREACFSTGECGCNLWPDCGVSLSISQLKDDASLRCCGKCVVESFETVLEPKLLQTCKGGTNLCARNFCDDHAGEGGKLCGQCDLGDDNNDNDDDDDD